MSPQDRLKSIVKSYRLLADPVFGLMTPEAMLHWAVTTGIATPSQLGISDAPKGKTPQVQGVYPLGDEQERYLQLAGGSKSPAVHRAARALAIGFTPQQVADLRFIAEGKGNGKARERLLAWTAAYPKVAEKAAKVAPPKVEEVA